jgi:WD40 repeat protein
VQGAPDRLPDAAPLANSTPKITDFGLAKWQGRDGLTATGEVAGTPSYMAPEQARGQNREIGPATDIYALGAILYECLTGRPPFKGPTHTDTLLQVLEQESVPPTRLEPGVPRDLETICLKCLHKQPQQRYASAAELADDLGRFLRREPIRARPVGAWERAAKWARRRPAVAALAAAVVLVTLLGVGLVSWQWREAVANAAESRKLAQAEAEARAGAQRHAAAEARARTQAQRLAVAEKQARARTERLLLSAEVNEALTVCERGDVPLGMLLLARALDKAVHLGDPNLERVIRVNLDGWRHRLLVKRAVLRHHNWVKDVAFSPDGTRVLTGSRDTMARLWDARTGQPVGAPLKHPHPVWSVAFSPDGRLILTGCGRPEGRQGEARLWDAATGKLLGEPLQTAGPVHRALFNRAGDRILTISRGQARLWQVAPPAAGGVRLLLLLPHSNAVFTALFSPDGKTVLTAGADGTARLWDAATGEAKGASLFHTGPVEQAAFSPDGRTLAVGCNRSDVSRNLRVGEVQLWDVAEGRTLGRGLLHPGPLKTLAFSPDGRTLLTGCIVPPERPGDPLRGQARLWDVGRAEPLGPALLHAGPVWAVAFNPDGRTFLTGCEDATARLWQTATGLPVGPLIKSWGNVLAVAFSPDGRTLLLGSADEPGIAQLWAAPPGQALGALAHPDKVSALALSPDGKALLTGCHDGKLRLWDLPGRAPIGTPLTLGNPGKTPARKPSGAPGPLPAFVRALAFHPDGKLAAAGCADRKVHLWDLSTRQPHAPPLLHKSPVVGVAFSPDGQTLATVQSDRRGPQRWRVADGVPLGESAAEVGQLWAVAYSAAGDKLLVGGHGGVCFYSSDGKPLGSHLLPAGPSGEQGLVWSAVWGPADKTFLTGDNRLAHRWDRATGKPVGPPFVHQGPVWALACSADGRTVLTGSGDRTARLWDAVTGKPLGPALEHPDEVRAVVLSRDGRSALTASDRNVYLWELPAAWPGTPERVRLELEVRTGRELDQRGLTRELDADAWRQRHRRLRPDR